MPCRLSGRFFVRTMTNKPKLIHRDDLPMDLAEAVVGALKGVGGDNKKVVFAGDLPEDQQAECADMLRRIEEQESRAIAEGLCRDCGKRVPGNWPPTPDAGGQEFKLPDGWRWWRCIGPGGRFIQCHECWLKITD